MDSIINSVKALEEQIRLLHKQALEQIEMKMRTYLELDEQIQYNGNLMLQTIMSRAQTWVQHDFLSKCRTDDKKTESMIKVSLIRLLKESAPPRKWGQTAGRKTDFNRKSMAS